MQNDSQTKVDRNTKANNQQSGYFNRGILLSLGVAIFTGLAIAALVWAYVWVCRTYLGTKADEIGIPGFVGLLGFVAIVAQIVVSTLQWRAMKEAASQTKELFLIGERAYLGIESAAPSVPLAVDRYPEVRIHLLNAGKTPAWNLTISLVLLPSVTTPPAEMVKLDLSKEWNIHFKRSFIPAGQRETMEIRQDKVKIEDDTIWVAVESLRLAFFYIVGEARYTDISGEETVLPIWLVYDPDSQNFVACDAVPDMWMWKGFDWSGFPEYDTDVNEIPKNQE